MLCTWLIMLAFLLCVPQLIILGESPYTERTVSSQWVHLLSMLRLLRLLRLLSVSKVGPAYFFPQQKQGS
jgi:hypothetical protein